MVEEVWQTEVLDCTNQLCFIQVMLLQFPTFNCKSGLAIVTFKYLVQKDHPAP